jgi:hypothetical protein
VRDCVSRHPKHQIFKREVLIGTGNFAVQRILFEELYQPARGMASKLPAGRLVHGARQLKNNAFEAGKVATQKLLEDKFAKPGRNLFQVLAGFENNGVGRKVVCPQYFG